MLLPKQVKAVGDTCFVAASRMIHSQGDCYQHNGLNRITKRDGTAFSHDLNGYLLDDGIRLYERDAFNRS